MASKRKPVQIITTAEQHPASRRFRDHALAFRTGTAVGVRALAVLKRHKIVPIQINAEQHPASRLHNLALARQIGLAAGSELV